MIADYFKYVKFDGDVLFFVLIPFFGSFVQTIHLAFWCYPINLPEVYWQELEASGLSWFIFKKNLGFILRRQPFRKGCYSRRKLDCTDIDDVENLQGSPRLVFIDEKYGNLIVVYDAGEQMNRNRFDPIFTRCKWYCCTI